MLVSIRGNTVEVRRIKGMPCFRTETAFWYALKKHMAEQYKCDLVKKVMSKDGHLVGGDNYPYYLRDRKWSYCIMDNDYCIRELRKDYNAGRIVRLALVRWDAHNSTMFNEPV